MQISPCPIALPLGKLAALAGVKFIAIHCSATRPTAIICLLLTGCSSLSVAPVLPEITIKIGMKPALMIKRDEVVTEVTP